MKNPVYTTLMFCSLAILTWQCQSDTIAENLQEIYFLGEVVNASSGGVRLFMTHGAEEIPLVNGRFSKKISSNRPQISDTYFNRKRCIMFSRPGDTIRVRMDSTGTRDTIIFFGAYAEENRFLSSLGDSIDIWHGITWKWYTRPEAVVIDSVDQLTQKGLAMIDAFAADKELDPAFLYHAHLFVKYRLGIILANYPLFYKKYSPEDSSYQMSALLKEKLAVLEEETPERMGVPGYVLLLSKLQSRLARSMYYEDTITYGGSGGYFKANLTAIQKYFKNPEIKEYLRMKDLSGVIYIYGPNMIQEEYENFIAEADNQVLVDNLKSKHDQWTRLKSGKPAPSFTFPDINDRLHALRDYRGKYVYLDVWATWCKPCIEEHPHLEALMAKYADNDNIVFMAIALDENKGVWKKMVYDKVLPDIQLIAEKGFKDPFVEDYNIFLLPRFILIDPNGNIIDARAAPPSSYDLQHQLEELLDFVPIIG